MRFDVIFAVRQGKDLIHKTIPGQLCRPCAFFMFPRNIEVLPVVVCFTGKKHYTQFLRIPLLYTEFPAENGFVCCIFAPHVFSLV